MLRAAVVGGGAVVPVAGVVGLIGRGERAGLSAAGGALGAAVMLTGGLVAITALVRGAGPFVLVAALTVYVTFVLLLLGLAKRLDAASGVDLTALGLGAVAVALAFQAAVATAFLRARHPVLGEGRR